MGKGFDMVGFCAVAWLWLSLCVPAQASGLGDTPISFFTSVAERLLQSQFNLSLSRIQVYPTNQYYPAVHRLLQVAANLYDATANNADPVTGVSLPTIFRPVFSY